MIGDELTIADISIYTWIQVHDWAGITLNNFPSILKWRDGLQARPSFVRGEQVPFINVSKKDLKKAIAEGGARVPELESKL